MITVTITKMIMIMITLITIITRNSAGYTVNYYALHYLTNIKRLFWPLKGGGRGGGGRGALEVAL